MLRLRLRLRLRRARVSRSRAQLQYRLERVDILGLATSVITVATPWWFAFSSQDDVQAYTVQADSGSHTTRTLRTGPHSTPSMSQARVKCDWPTR